ATISWNSTDTTAVEVRLDSPSGTLFAHSASGSHSLTTGKWVGNGKTFYLQNVSGGLPLTAGNTLAKVTVSVNNGHTITADPNPVVVTDGTGLGVTTVSWSTIASVAQVHVYAPDGPLMSESGPGHWSTTTGKWVSNGTSFYLQDVSDGYPLNAAH